MWISIWRPLPFLILSNKKFDSKNVPGPDYQSLCQIWREFVQNWRSYRHAATILDFWQYNWLPEPFFSICIKFGAFAPILAQLWILWQINFAIETSFGASFSVSASNLEWIHPKMTELLPFNWLQNGGRRHIGFLRHVNFEGISYKLL